MLVLGSVPISIILLSYGEHSTSGSSALKGVVCQPYFVSVIVKTDDLSSDMASLEIVRAVTLSFHRLSSSPVAGYHKSSSAAQCFIPARSTTTKLNSNNVKRLQMFFLSHPSGSGYKETRRNPCGR